MAYIVHAVLITTYLPEPLAGCFDMHIRDSARDAFTLRDPAPYTALTSTSLTSVFVLCISILFTASVPRSDIVSRRSGHINNAWLVCARSIHVCPSGTDLIASYRKRAPTSFGNHDSVDTLLVVGRYTVRTQMRPLRPKLDPWRRE